jgi:hypothetical protein
MGILPSLFSIHLASGQCVTRISTNAVSPLPEQAKCRQVSPSKSCKHNACVSLPLGAAPSLTTWNLHKADGGVHDAVTTGNDVSDGALKVCMLIS